MIEVFCATRISLNENEISRESVFDERFEYEHAMNLAISYQLMWPTDGDRSQHDRWADDARYTKVCSRRRQRFYDRDQLYLATLIPRSMSRMVQSHHLCSAIHCYRGKERVSSSQVHRQEDPLHCSLEFHLCHRLIREDRNDLR